MDAPPLDRDVYCLACRYNLRGLAGDPVRCPECGRSWPRQELLGTVRAAAQRFRELKAALDMLAIGAIAIATAVVGALFAAVGGGPYVLPALALLLAAGAFPTATSVVEVRRLARAPGWGRPLAWYVATTLGIVASIPGAWLAGTALLWVGGLLAHGPSEDGLGLPLAGGAILAVVFLLAVRPIGRLRHRQAAAFRDLVRLTGAGELGDDAAECGRGAGAPVGGAGDAAGTTGAGPGAAPDAGGNKADGSV